MSSSRALGALAPSFPALVATQAVGRPLGLTLDFLIAVVVAEEMPRNSRAYAVSLMAMASGYGAGIAVLSRYVRSQMLEVQGQDYVRTAKAKGLPDEQVHYKHALRNALLPFVTMFGLILPGLIGGSVIIESIFSWPGIGRALLTASTSEDIPVAMGILTILGVLTLVSHLIVDVGYAFLDPRIRYS